MKQIKIMVTVNTYGCKVDFMSLNIAMSTMLQRKQIKRAYWKQSVKI